MAGKEREELRASRDPYNLRDGGRPVPDEAPLDEYESRGSRPERRERPLGRAAGPTDLSRRDWLEIFKRAGKRTISDNMPMVAQALAYSAFMAIPSVLLVVLGVFTLFAGPQAIASLMQHFSSVMPQQATQLLGKNLTRLSSHHSAGVTMTVVGFVFALWSTTGAMTSFMTGLNRAYERDETRSFMRKRFVALAMAACISAAFVLVAVLLIFGPAIEHYLGRALGIQGVLAYVWWAAQWPILLLGLLAAFATLLYLGPNVEHRRWAFLSVGTAVAVVVWLAVSGLFAFYTSHFGSYNKTWGSLSAVIVMLTWLWLTSLALLFGGEVNAEAKRSREPRRAARHRLRPKTLTRA
jgi:membrane protein